MKKQGFFKKYTFVQIVTAIVVYQFSATLVADLTHNKALMGLIRTYVAASSHAAVLQDRLSRGCASETR